MTHILDSMLFLIESYLTVLATSHIILVLRVKEKRYIVRAVSSFSFSGSDMCFSDFQVIHILQLLEISNILSCSFTSSNFETGDFLLPFKVHDIYGS